MRQLVAAGASLAKIRIGFIFKRDTSWYLPKMSVPIVFNLVAGAGKKSVWGKYCCKQGPFLVERVWTLDAENGPRKPSTSLAAHPAQELQLCFLSLFFFFLVAPCCRQDLRSSNGDGNCAPCSGSADSYPLDRQRSPVRCFRRNTDSLCQQSFEIH